MRRRILLIALALMLIGVAALASVVQPGEEFFYLDKANVLSEATEGEIFYSNVNLEQECGAQIVVVAIDSTNGEAIDDYTYDLFNSWGIGDSKKNNGFLLLMAIKDDNYYAMAGDGLDSKLTGGVLQDYLDNELEPYFAKQDYDTGTRKFFEKIYDRVASIYNAKSTVQDGIRAYEAYLADGDTGSKTGTQVSVPSPSRPATTKSGSGGSAAAGLILLILIIIVVIVLGTNRRRRTGSFFVRRRRPIAPPPPPMVGPRPPMGGQVPPAPRAPAGRPLGTPRPSGNSFGNSRPSSFSSSSRPASSSRPSSFGSSRPASSSRPSSFSSSRSSSSSRSFSSAGRSSSSRSSSRSFGSARSGGGHTRGGGAGRGRH